MTNHQLFHLIGVGGAGMSALARLLLDKKHTVSGSDSQLSSYTKELQKRGVQIFQGHQEQNIDPSSIVVYSTAIEENNPEMLRAKSLGCTLWHRSELLQYLAKDSKSLAVAGTHGKTSTAALLAHVCKIAQQEPSYVVGGVLTQYETNSESSEGPHFIFEADESDGSLIRYHPDGAILTNLEEDHLDYFFRNYAHLEQVMLQFIQQVKEDKAFFWCMDCPNLRRLNPKGLSYGFDAQSDLHIFDYAQMQTQCQFSVNFQGKIFKKITLNLMGRHNACNAVAVMGLALSLGISIEYIREAFASFKGVKRRSEKLGSTHQIQFYDDYAHHPTEVKALLKSFRKAYPKRRIIALFQPHRYSRIKYFQKEFASSFSKASEVWLTNVYSAGETPEDSFSIHDFAKEIEQLSQVGVTKVDQEQLSAYYQRELKPFDVVISIGAGDISKKAREAFEIIREKSLKLKVGVIYGGQSPEHFISKISKNFVFEGLEAPWFDVKSFFVDLEGQFHHASIPSDHHIPLNESIFQLINECDFFFPVLHGPNGEDGMVQGFLKTLQKPFAGSDFSACHLAMNKFQAKQLVQEKGVKVAKGILIQFDEFRKNPSRCAERVKKTLTYPLIVKPNRMGSTLGLSQVNKSTDLEKALSKAFVLDREVCVEEKIVGREFEMVVFEGDHVICPPPGEIISATRFYDYEAKYSKNPIEKIPVAQLSKKYIEKSRKMGKAVFNLLGASGFLRIDFFIDKSGELIFGEANAIPGMTPRSLFPRMLKAYGFTARQICEQIIIHGLYQERLLKKQNRLMLDFASSLKDVTE